MIELEGQETADPIMNLGIWLTGYWFELKTLSQKGLKDAVEGHTNSNETINNNPIYNQQTKDNLHDLEKISGIIEITAATLDPEIQVINTLTPVDGVLTLTTGNIYETGKLRKATPLEKVMAGVDVASFMGEVSAASKPVSRAIVAEGALNTTATESAPEVYDIVKNFDLDNSFIDGVDNLVGRADLGWYTGNTAHFEIDAILKSQSNSGSVFKSLIEKVEAIATKNNLNEVMIEFKMVVNSRLRNDTDNWARQYGYYFSSQVDETTGAINVTWTKTLN